MTLSVAEAEAFVAERTSNITGSFYGPCGELALGTGLIFGGVRYPLYEPNRNIFLTVAGPALVLTHECDIDPENGRTLNSDVLILPLTAFSDFAGELVPTKSKSEAKAYLGDLLAHRVSQMMYLPPLPPELPHGAILYLNRITFTHRDAFLAVGVTRIAALSAIGLRQFDYCMENHIRRPKADILPLTRTLGRARD